VREFLLLFRPAVIIFFFCWRQNGDDSSSTSPWEITLYDFFPFPEITRQAM
jgi:hypothetical protein